MIEVVAGDAVHVGRSKVAETPFRVMIVAMQFGPGFLEKDRPQLGLVCRTESRSAAIARNRVVNCDRCFEPIHVEVDEVDTGSVGLFGLKHPLDLVGSFRQRRNRCQVIAIAQLALVDIIGMNSAAEQFVAVLPDFLGSLPLK